MDSSSGHRPGAILPLGMAVKPLVNSGIAEKDMQRAAEVIADRIAMPHMGQERARAESGWPDALYSDTSGMLFPSLSRNISR